MNDSIENLEKLIASGNRVRLKASLITDDGVNWLILRQHYTSCPETGQFLDLFLQGETLKFEKMENKNETNTPNREKHV
ncbi:hypothetical protein ACFLT2_01345 [Acidobacteriota bacterium]